MDYGRAKAHSLEKIMQHVTVLWLFLVIVLIPHEHFHMCLITATNFTVSFIDILCDYPPHNWMVKEKLQLQSFFLKPITI